MAFLVGRVPFSTDKHYKYTENSCYCSTLVLKDQFCVKAHGKGNLQTHPPSSRQNGACAEQAHMGRKDLALSFYCYSSNMLFLFASKPNTRPQGIKFLGLEQSLVSCRSRLTSTSFTGKGHDLLLEWERKKKSLVN